MANISNRQLWRQPLAVDCVEKKYLAGKGRPAPGKGRPVPPGRQTAPRPAKGAPPPPHWQKAPHSAMSMIPQHISASSIILYICSRYEVFRNCRYNFLNNCIIATDYSKYFFINMLLRYCTVKILGYKSRCSQTRSCASACAWAQVRARRSRLNCVHACKGNY